MNEVLVIADDLTGALEAGAAFAQNGLQTAVTFGADAETTVLVIDSETRHMRENEAAARVAKLVQSHPARLIYKKTDSTLRGHIRPELQALLPHGDVLFVPAYPQMGRTIHEGRLHVHGLPLLETVFTRDSLNPVAEDNVVRLLAGAGVTVSHANTEPEIRALAAGWLSEGGIAAGPTGFLHEAARLMRRDAHFVPDYPPIDRPLVVVGSRHPVSLEQATYAARVGWPLMTICEPAGSESAGSDPLQCASLFGKAVVDNFQRRSADTLIIFGGDTARACLTALGIHRLQPVGDVLPGIPLSLLPDGRKLISKAGGFGPPDVLLQIRRQLTDVSTR